MNRYALNEDKDLDLEEMILGMTEIMRERRYYKLVEAAARDEARSSSQSKPSSRNVGRFGQRYSSSRNKFSRGNSMQFSAQSSFSSFSK